MSATLAQNFRFLIELCLHWLSVVHGFWDAVQVLALSKYVSIYIDKGGPHTKKEGITILSIYQYFASIALKHEKMPFWPKPVVKL